MYHIWYIINTNYLLVTYKLFFFLKRVCDINAMKNWLEIHIYLDLKIYKISSLRIFFFILENIKYDCEFVY